VTWVSSNPRRLRRAIEYTLSRTPVFRSIYWNFAPQIYYWKRKSEFGMNTKLNPFLIREADPLEISRFTGREDAVDDRWKDIGRIRAGNWDKKGPSQDLQRRSQSGPGVFISDKVEDTILYNSFEEHFIDNIDWADTELFNKLLSIIEKKSSAWNGCSSRSELLKKCEAYDLLYHEMQTNGYKTQWEIIKKSGLQPEHTTYLDVLTNEVCVDIGRNGELLFVDGRHRLTMAKILGIEKIPITILIRHKEWMNKREQIMVEIDEDNIEHPDATHIG